MLCFASKITNNANNPEYLKQKFAGCHRKTLPEEMVCFLQASQAYLTYYKEHDMHLPQKNKELNERGDNDLKEHEMRLAKYMDRMYDIVQCRFKKYG
jgi:hypothetical protein